MFNMPNLCRHQGDQIPSIDLRVPKKANAEHEDQEGRQQTALTHQGACHHEWGAAKQSEGLCTNQTTEGGKLDAPTTVLADYTQP